MDEYNKISPSAAAEIGSQEERRKIADILATILSWVLVPTLVPVYAMIFILWLSPLSLGTNVTVRFIVTAIIFGFSCVLPMIIVLILKVLGIVTDVGLNKRRQRAIPYATVILSYLLSAWYLLAHGAPDWVVTFYAGGALAALVNMIINFRWKISAHSAAMGGVCVVMVRIAQTMPDTRSLVWLCIWLALTGLLGSARIWLRRHTLLQVLAGCAVGALSVYLTSFITF